MAGSRSVLLMAILRKNIAKLNRPILAETSHATWTLLAPLVCTFKSEMAEYPHVILYPWSNFVEIRLGDETHEWHIPYQCASFLGAFSKLRKATVAFVMSVHPHGTAGLPLDGYSRNLIFEDFSNIRRENSSSIKIWEEYRALYMKTNVHMITSHSVLLRMRNVSDKSCRENQNTYLTFSDFFIKGVDFPTARMVTRTRLSVTLCAHCLAIHFVQRIRSGNEWL